MPANDSIEHIWEQQPSEKNLWYDRFARYLALGAGRSVRAVYQAEQGSDESKSVPASWTEASHRHEWQRRAEAYDAWRRAAVFQAGNAADTERVKKLDDVIEQLHKRVMDMLKNAPPEILFNDRVIAQYFAALDLMAKHTGGYAPQRHEVTGKDGNAIQVEGEAAMQVVFYVPEIAEIAEVSDVPPGSEVGPVAGIVEQGDGDEQAGHGD